MLLWWLLNLNVKKNTLKPYLYTLKICCSISIKINIDVRFVENVLVSSQIAYLIYQNWLKTEKKFPFIYKSPNCRNLPIYGQHNNQTW